MGLRSGRGVWMAGGERWRGAGRWMKLKDGAVDSGWGC